MIFFKYYLATCLNNNSKYIDVQHNGTYFIFDNNVHFDISSLFRHKFIDGVLLVKNFQIVLIYLHYTQFKKIFQKRKMEKK